ncbi:MAG: alginate lyase family protein [Pseudodesulfovibrio sp.]
MPALRLAVLLLLLLTALPAAAASLPETILYAPEALARARQGVLQRDPALMPAFRALIKDADRAVTAPAEAVVLKPAPPPGGTRHDYWSLDPDWWPDPARLGGRPYKHRPGKRNPEADTDKYDRSRMRRMAADALTLAQAWFLTGNEQYAGKGSALVWSWCCDSLTRTAPRLTSGRARPGVADGDPSGIIETRDLIKVAEAARLLESSKAWNPVETRRLKQWFEEYVHWLLENEFGRAEAAAPGEHSLWYDAQVAVFALYAGDKSLARSMVGTLDRRRIGVQIGADGAIAAAGNGPDARRAAFSCLQALFTLAAVGERLGIDVWRWSLPQTGSVKAAFDRYAPSIADPADQDGRFEPLAFTPLFHRAALVYEDRRYLNLLGALPEADRRTDRALLFH